MKSCSLHHLLRLALPFGSKLLTNKAALGRQVEHAVSLRATLPAFPTLHGNELVVLSVQDALALDDGLTLPKIIAGLGHIPVTAIAVIGPVDEEALAQASDADLPVLQLPITAASRTVERDVLLTLDKPDMQLERRAAQLYSELTQQVARGAGVEGVLCTVHEATGWAMAFYDATGELRLQYGACPPPAVFAALHPTRAEHLRVEQESILVKGVRQGANTVGFVAIGGTTLDAWDDLAAERASAALALELSKQQAVQAVEARAGGDLLQAIMNGSAGDVTLLHEQAYALGYDLRQPHVALLIAPATTKTSLSLVQERLHAEIQNAQTSAPYLVRDTTLLCFYPYDERLEQAGGLLQKLMGELAIDVGISSPTSTTAGWQQAYEQAQQALTLGHQLFGPCSVTAFGDLQVYRLLVELRGSDELVRFHQSILGPLVDYDRQHNNVLVPTLERYFEAQGNLRETAERLQIHRNTLLYRLRRIGQIANVDMERTEDTLALQLALKAHRVLGLPGAASPHRRNGSNGNGRH